MDDIANEKEFKIVRGDHYWYWILGIVAPSVYLEVDYSAEDLNG